MNRAYRYALSTLGVLLIVAIATNINVPPTAAAGSAPVTVVNTPLPVSVTGTAGITGAVSISNTPDVRVTNFPVRLPYNFTLSGSYSPEGFTGFDGSDSHTLPQGTSLLIRHVSCDSNTSNESSHPLRIHLSRAVGPTGATSLAALTVNALQNGTRRYYNVTQETHAYLGPTAGSLSTQSTIQLFATIDEGDIFGFVQCYVAGELFQYGQ